jgi:hypothetical protein
MDNSVREYSATPSFTGGLTDSEDSDTAPQARAVLYRQAVEDYPRTTSIRPQPTVGFGTSTYGLHPGNVVLAQSGDAADLVDAGVLNARYRTDNSALYRWDSRPPVEIFANGFTPQSHQRPESIRAYQKERLLTRYVSTTRSPRFDSPARGEWAAAADGKYYQYEIQAPGGMDLVESLQQFSYADQQEVIFDNGIRPEFISGVRVFDGAGNRIGKIPNAGFLGAALDAAAAPQQQYRQAAATSRNSPTGSASGSESEKSMSISDSSSHGMAPGAITQLRPHKWAPVLTSKSGQSGSYSQRQRYSAHAGGSSPYRAQTDSSGNSLVYSGGAPWWHVMGKKPTQTK